VNTRQANKIFKNYRVKGPRGNRGRGHRFDTLSRTFSKKLSMLQRKYGILEGYRIMAKLDYGWARSGGIEVSE
jgi:hypothetical protein